MPTYKVLLEYSHIYVLTMTAFTWQMTRGKA